MKEVPGLSGFESMLLQICTDYSSLPDIKEMTIDEIEFFYKPLVPGLLEAQKKKNKG